MFAQLEFHPQKSSTVKHDWHNRNDRRKGRKNLLLWRHFRLEENSLWDNEALLNTLQRLIRLDVLQITCSGNLPPFKRSYSVDVIYFLFFSSEKVSSPASVAYVGVKERTSLETGTSHFCNHLLTISSRAARKICINYPRCHTYI